MCGHFGTRRGVVPGGSNLYTPPMSYHHGVLQLLAPVQELSPPSAEQTANLVRSICSNNVTFYSLSLPSSGNTAVSIHSVTSHTTTPRPRVLSQTADSVAMLWNEDLLDLVAGLSETDKKRVEEIKVKVKTPTPRILEKGAPEAFELAYSQGGATVTFTSKSGTKFAEVDSQVNGASLLL